MVKFHCWHHKDIPDQAIILEADDCKEAALLFAGTPEIPVLVIVQQEGLEYGAMCRVFQNHVLHVADIVLEDGEI